MGAVSHPGEGSRGNCFAPRRAARCKVQLLDPNPAGRGPAGMGRDLPVLLLGMGTVWVAEPGAVLLISLCKHWVIIP